MINQKKSKLPLKWLMTSVELTTLDRLSSDMSAYAKVNGFTFYRSSLPKFNYYMTLWLKRDDVLIYLGTDGNLVINASNGIDPNRISGPIKIEGNIYAGEKRQANDQVLNQIADDVSRILRAVSATGEVQLN